MTQVTCLARLFWAFRIFRVCRAQSSVHCLLVQLLQGKPITTASHFTLRVRQGIQALLAVTERFESSSDVFLQSLLDAPCERRETCFVAPAMTRRYHTADRLLVTTVFNGLAAAVDFVMNIAVGKFPKFAAVVGNLLTLTGRCCSRERPRTAWCSQRKFRGTF